MRQTDGGAAMSDAHIKIQVLWLTEMGGRKLPLQITMDRKPIKFARKLFRQSLN